MSFFTGKTYNTATQIEAFIDSLNTSEDGTRISYRYEEILKTDPILFNREKLCKYINSEHFKKHKQNCAEFYRIYKNTKDNCVELSGKRYIINNHNNLTQCSAEKLNSAKIVWSIYKLMDRINNGETGAMDPNIFFKIKLDEIKSESFKSDFKSSDFEKAIGKVDCELPTPSIFSKGGKHTKRRQGIKKGTRRKKRGRC